MVGCVFGVRVVGLGLLLLRTCGGAVAWWLTCHLRVVSGWGWWLALGCERRPSGVLGMRCARADSTSGSGGALRRRPVAGQGRERLSRVWRYGGRVLVLFDGRGSTRPVRPLTAQGHWRHDEALYLWFTVGAAHRGQ